MAEFKIKVEVDRLAKHFNLTQVCGNEHAADKRYVVVVDVNRPGLELSGFKFDTNPRRIIIIGKKEQKYLESLDEQTQYERFIDLTDIYTPMIIVTHGKDVPAGLKRRAAEVNFPVYSSPLTSSRLVADLTTYLDEQLAEEESRHGVLMNLYGIGVFITGESGMGKSEVALEMIKKGHVLISDDRVDFKRVARHIVGRAPELLKGFLEIRGIGIIDVTRMFGSSAVSDSTNVDLVIHFEPYVAGKEYARVGIEVNLYEDILGVKVNKLVIPVMAGRSMGTLLESAVAQYKLKQNGYDSSKEFEAKVYNYILEKDKENSRKEDK